MVGGLATHRIVRRQPRFLCPICHDRFADHQPHVDVLMGYGGIRKAHRGCAQSWLRKTSGPLLTRHVPIIDGRER